MGKEESDESLVNPVIKKTQSGNTNNYIYPESIKDLIAYMKI